MSAEFTSVHLSLSSFNEFCALERAEGLDGISYGNFSDDEDDTAELLAELQRIKKERAQEEARKVNKLKFIIASLSFLSVFLHCFHKNSVNPQNGKKRMKEVTVRKTKMLKFMSPEQKSTSFVMKLIHCTFIFPFCLLHLFSFCESPECQKKGN